jgi:hypothetical protein
MPKPLPPPPTLGELLAEPVVLNIHETCRALRMSPSHAYKLLADGTFPVPVMGYGEDGDTRRRGVPLLFRLADVLAFLGFDLAGVARELGLHPAESPSPAGDHGERAA